MDFTLAASSGCNLTEDGGEPSGRNFLWLWQSLSDRSLWQIMNRVFGMGFRACSEGVGPSENRTKEGRLCDELATKGNAHGRGIQGSP